MGLTRVTVLNVGQARELLVTRVLFIKRHRTFTAILVALFLNVFTTNLFLTATSGDKTCTEANLPTQQHAALCIDQAARLAGHSGLHRRKLAQQYLWHALTLAKQGSPVQAKALHGVLFFYQPEVWATLAGVPLPTYHRQGSGGVGARSIVGDRGWQLPATAKGQSYLSQVFYNGQPLRWGASQLPLKVYVNQVPTNVPYFDKRYVSAVPKAFRLWSAALDNQLTTVMVPTPAEADITIDWQAQVGQAATISGQSGEGKTIAHGGLTQPALSQGQLVGMAITLSVQSPNGQPASPRAMASILLHEVGHALGLMGHSSNPSDVMASQNGGLQNLTPNDVATIRDLYNQGVGRPENPLDSESLPEGTPMAGLDAQISQARAATLNNPTWLEWNNYGKSLYNKAMALQQSKGSTAQRNRLLSQANAAFAQAQQSAPNLVDPALGQVATLRAQSHYREAEQQLRQLQRQFSDEPRVYQEQVVVYASLDKPTQGRQALAEYLRLRPGELSQPWVTQAQALFNR